MYIDGYIRAVSRQMQGCSMTASRAITLMTRPFIKHQASG